MYLIKQFRVNKTGSIFLKLYVRRIGTRSRMQVKHYRLLLKKEYCYFRNGKHISGHFMEDGKKCWENLLKEQ